VDNRTQVDYASHPVIIKARELSAAMVESEASKKNMAEEVRRMIVECNQMISAAIRLDYGAAARSSSGCC
jgi:hypothetical protein